MLSLPRPTSFRGLIFLVAAYDLLLKRVTTYILPWMATNTALPDSLSLWAPGSHQTFTHHAFLCLSLNFAVWLYDPVTEFEREDTAIDTNDDIDRGYDADTESCYDGQGSEEEEEDRCPDNVTRVTDVNVNVNAMETPQQHPDYFCSRRIDHLGRRNAWDWTNIPTHPVNDDGHQKH
ncbi:hypothetical protein AYL99_06700 [Fonsecaea erecta]|uniref:Uncharacterized protein n=1 Tax=Fonsecaea erecta TaxID=1367422 RepID=A0A178ZID1_9EURO|nr:hypothetical protein AYL99_06700 [Fonsecaea erecta]OAP59402.1 hypothetical protein AYL99_06700 [Fonsecaea erecta]